LVHSDAFTRFDYGPTHPLRMERLGLTWRLMEAYGLTTLPNATVHAPAPASERALEVWHTREYLEVLKAANGGVAPPHAERYGLGAGVGYSVNLPLEPFTDSSVYLPAFEQVVPPLLGAFRPDVVVAQLGIDSHRTDPLTHLAFDVQGFTRAVARIAELAPRLVCLGGGGYDLPNVARAWTAAWAVLNGVELPAELPASFE